MTQILINTEPTRHESVKYCPVSQENRKYKINGRYFLEVELECLPQENDVPSSREEIEVIFSGADKDGSGQLNIKEFPASSKAVNMVKEAENSSSSTSSGQKR